MKPPKLLIALPSLALAALAARAEILERVIAKVNGDIVTLTEFQSRQLAAAQQARTNPEQVAAFLRENNARILQEAIDDLLLLQRAGELGIRLRGEAVTEIIEGIKKENNLPSDQDLQEQLRREGMSLEDLKRNIERSILRRQVLARELEPKVAVSEAEVRADYDARLAEHTTPAQVRLQEILVKGDGAEARAAELVGRARSGEDFGALARADSEAPTRAAGGELGVVAHGELNPELEAVAFGLPAGGISDPVKTKDGVRILRVAERSERKVVPFDEVKAQIRERLAQERWGKEYQRYVEGLRKSAIIDIKVREVPLQLLGAPSAPSLLDAPQAPPSPSVAPAAPPSDAEIVTTPQDRPEHVVSPPQPVPSPSPPPRSS